MSYKQLLDGRWNAECFSRKDGTYLVALSYGRTPIARDYPDEAFCVFAPVSFLAEGIRATSEEEAVKAAYKLLSRFKADSRDPKESVHTL